MAQVDFSHHFYYLDFALKRLTKNMANVKQDEYKQLLEDFSHYERILLSSVITSEVIYDEKKF